LSSGILSKVLRVEAISKSNSGKNSALTPIAILLRNFRSKNLTLGQPPRSSCHDMVYIPCHPKV
jgi:hypothetical protein